MFLQQVINGIAIGSTYALVAIGYSLVFGVLKIINFANGSLYMAGAYITLLFYGALKRNIIISIVASLLLVGIMAYSVDVIGLRKLRKDNAPKMSGLITTLGIATVIDNVIQIFIGTETKAFPNFLNFGKLKVGSLVINSTQVLIFAICVVIMLAFSLLVYKTKFGKAMQAVSQNIVAAKLMGIDTKFVISATFIMSGVLASLAGSLVGTYYGAIDTTLGASVGMKPFSAAVLGGVGSLPGAMIGGLIVGLAEALGASYISSGYRDAIAFVILIMVLLINPTGILGKTTIEKM